MKNGDVRARQDALLSKEKLKEEVLVLKDGQSWVPCKPSQHLCASHEEVVCGMHHMALAGSRAEGPEGTPVAWRGDLEKERVVIYLGHGF
eukprot:7389631-Prymnesium_polylepis.1